MRRCGRVSAGYVRPRGLPILSPRSPGNHLAMLRLLTLGGLAVHGPDGPLTGSAAQPRRLAVLALVARSGKRGVSRAKLLGLLWPDAREEQGRRVLAQALYALRRDLGDDRAVVGNQDVRLDPDVLWCDV